MKENTCSKMETTTLVPFTRECDTEKGVTSGKTKVGTKASGSRTKCTATEHT